MPLLRTSGLPAPRGCDPLTHYRRPNGWEVLTNFGAAPTPLPAGVGSATVVLSSGAPWAAGDFIPAETTLWLAP